MKFNQNPSSESRVIPCGQTDRQIRKLIVALRNFANVPKIGEIDVIMILIKKFCICLHNKSACIYLER